MNADNQSVATPIRLIRKKRVLEKVPFSKSTLHALLQLSKKKRLADDDPEFLPFPAPIYLNGGRIPFWNETEVDDWIAAQAARGCAVAALVPDDVAATQAPEAPRTTTSPELRRITMRMHPASSLGGIRQGTDTLVRP